jgi:ornithine cyclodeaminase/alanine dehydrogenase-like protein (mu-crystallin family)
VAVIEVCPCANRAIASRRIRTNLVSMKNREGDQEEITVFRSVGYALEDLVAAELLLAAL